jgi:predicted RNase H-like HicB family nuclease
MGVMNMRYRILIEQDEDGIFVAECPSLPGCISQGKTRNEALENIQDAIKGYIESLKKHNEPIPPSINEEIVEVAV